MSPLTPQTTLSLGRAPPNMPATPVAKTSTAITRPPLIAIGYRETQRYKVRMPCMHALLSLGWQEPSRSATILNVLLIVPGMLFQDSAKYVDLLAPITFASAPSRSPWTSSLIPPRFHPCVRAQVSQSTSTRTFLLAAQWFFCPSRDRGTLPTVGWAFL